MAYRLIQTPLFQDIPDHIIDFALNDAGWSSAGTNRITTANSEPGVSFELATATGSAPSGQRLEARVLNGELILGRGVAINPYIGMTWLAPSKLHLFGNLDPEPFVAAVVEFGDGFFRHLYLGHLQKFGDYTGGEVVSGCAHYVQSAEIPFRHQANAYLFGGVQAAFESPIAGGVRIDHADVGGAIFAPFRAATSRTSGSALTANAAMGGFGDNINDQQLYRGQNTFAGVQVFNPINLLLTRPSNRCTPIGVPPGVRLVNMQNVGAGSAISVGGKSWRCYPQFRRGGTVKPANPSPSTNMTTESSYIVGYAYLED